MLNLCHIVVVAEKLPKLVPCVDFLSKLFPSDGSACRHWQE
jgi:hypothetical protein